MGYYFIEAGLITSDRVDEALIEQRTNPDMRLGEILVERGWSEQNTLDYFVKKIIESDSTQMKINLEQKQNQHKYVDDFFDSSSERMQEMMDTMLVSTVRIPLLTRYWRRLKRCLKC